MSILKQLFQWAVAIGGILIFVMLALFAYLLEPSKNETAPFPRPPKWSFRCTWVCLLIAVLVGLAYCTAHAGELSLCYDRVRWTESAAVAKRKGAVVLNVDDGRGSVASEAAAWDAFGVRCRTVGGLTFGYVDFLNQQGKRKLSGEVVLEAQRWLDHGHSGVWLDDARDNGADADVVRAILKAYPKTIVIANPGTKVSDALKRAGAFVCESESNGAVYYGDIVIAFVKDRAASDAVLKEANRRGVLWCATEPLATYHRAGIEYQKKNPFIRP